jgi:hypothetical protein
MKTRGSMFVAPIFFISFLTQADFLEALRGLPVATGPTQAQTTSTKAVRFDGCDIAVSSVYFWRDWMPIVQHPGPDQGSPLYSKVKLRIENTTSASVKLLFKAVAIDEQGQSYPATFDVQPDYTLLPKRVYDGYSSLDAQAKKYAATKYGLIWDGGLKPGEVREVELVSHDGPYLPPGRRVHIAFTFSDPEGHSAIIRSPSDIIQRTD